MAPQPFELVGQPRHHRGIGPASDGLSRDDHFVGELVADDVNLRRVNLASVSVIEMEVCEHDLPNRLVRNLLQLLL